MDQNRIDEAVLVLLYLGIHERHQTMPGAHTWKSLDWDAMDRLHDKGLISDPATKARSVLLTEAGLREAAYDGSQALRPAPCGLEAVTRGRCLKEADARRRPVRRAVRLRWPAFSRG